MQFSISIILFSAMAGSGHIEPCTGYVLDSVLDIRGTVKYLFINRSGLENNSMTGNQVQNDLNHLFII